ncbi:MAG: glycosyltransferase family 39 protein [Thermoanaerobaculia bacterium]
MSTRRRTTAVVFSIAALALAVRLAFATAFARTPIGASIFLDSKTYDDLAVALRQGTGAALEPFFVEPLYGYFLAVVYGIFGRGLWPVRVLQALGGALSCALIFDLARRLYGRRAGIVAGLAAALYGPFVFYDAMLLKTSGEVLCATLLLWLLLRATEEDGGELTWAAVGLQLGLAATLKANFLVLAPVALAAPWLAAGVGRRRRIARAAWVAGGIALALAPVLVRNSALAGEPTFLTSGAGMNFYQGNREGTDGGLAIPPFIGLDPSREQEDSLAEARRRTGEPELTAAEASRFWLRRSLDWIRSHPVDWLRLMGRKVLLFWNRYEAADDLSFHYTRHAVPLLWLAPIGFWLVAPLGLAGTLAGAGGGRREWLLRASVLLLAAGTVLFHVADRYRLAAVPALIVLAVGFVRRTVLAWTGGRRRAACGLAALAVAALLFVNVPDLYPGGQDMAPFDRIMALGYREGGRPERAAPYATRAAEAYTREAAAATARGDSYRAEIYLVNALDVRPDDPDSWRLLSRLRFDAGRWAAAGDAAERGLATAPDDPALLVLLGDVRALEHRFEEALALFERALAADPGADAIERRVTAARAALESRRRP